MHEQQLPHIDATVCGYTFAEFKNLDNAHVAQLADELEQRLWVEEEGWVSEAAIVKRLFNQFVYYRRYGMPDRVVSDDELAEYVTDLLDNRVYGDVLFGMTPACHVLLDTDALATTEVIIAYMVSVYHPSEMPRVDKADVIESLAVPAEQLTALIKCGVLTPFIDDEQASEEEYMLTDDYYAHWLCRAIAEYYGVGRGY